MKKKPTSHKVHRDLKGYDIKVNTFGELKSNRSIDDINEFLNKHTSDKRIGDQEPIGKLEEE